MRALSNQQENNTSRILRSTCQKRRRTWQTPSQARSASIDEKRSQVPTGHVARGHCSPRMGKQQQEGTAREIPNRYFFIIAIHQIDQLLTFLIHRATELLHGARANREHRIMRTCYIVSLWDFFSASAAPWEYRLLASSFWHSNFFILMYIFVDSRELRAEMYITEVLFDYVKINTNNANILLVPPSSFTDHTTHAYMWSKSLLCECACVQVAIYASVKWENTVTKSEISLIKTCWMKVCSGLFSVCAQSLPRPGKRCGEMKSHSSWSICGSALVPPLARMAAKNKIKIKTN